MSDPIPREHHIKSEDHYLVYIPKSKKACIRERERERERGRGREREICTTRFSLLKNPKVTATGR
jgi:hypothetical protein